MQSYTAPPLRLASGHVIHRGRLLEWLRRQKSQGRLVDVDNLESYATTFLRVLEGLSQARIEALINEGRRLRAGGAGNVRAGTKQGEASSPRPSKNWAPT